MGEEMQYSNQFIEYLADFICGDGDRYPEYRSSSYLTNFFQNIDIDVTHDGSTRKLWVRGVLENLSQDDRELVIKTLVSPILYFGNKDKLKLAIESMNELLQYEDRKIIFEGRDPIIIAHESTIEDILSENPSKPKESVSQDSGDFSANMIISGNNNSVVTNIYQTAPQDTEISRLFRELTKIAGTIQENRDILSSIKEMQNTINTTPFKEKYKNFIASIADHMTIFLPLIPALSRYL